MALRWVVEYENEGCPASLLRKRRLRHVQQLIDRHFYSKRPPSEITIVDIGGRRHYWNLLDVNYLIARRVRITLLNLSSESALDVDKESSIFTTVTGDGCELGNYDDNSFDIAHANSVIEHVGSWENMERFANNMRRIALSYYVQTPYYWFPFEPHSLTPFFHWLPEGWRARLLMWRSLGNYPRAKTIGEAMRMVRDAHLLDIAQMRYLFPDARLRLERFGPLPPKSMMAIRSFGTAYPSRRTALNNGAT
jgi:hypothetical protein